MQEDLKIQLQRALGQWRKKGHKAFDQLFKDVKGEVRGYLLQQGLAERWPSVVSLIEEILPEFAPKAASYIGKKVEPLADYLDLRVTHWKPYQLTLQIEPKSHLISGAAWHTSSLVSMSELAGRWLLEKHAPPGDLQIRVSGLELKVLERALDHCTVRCELDAAEFEKTMAELLKNKCCDVFLPVLVFSSNDVLLSQMNFHFELQWAALLK